MARLGSIGQVGPVKMTSNLTPCDWAIANAAMSHADDPVPQFYIKGAPIASKRKGWGIREVERGK